ncbi:S-layer homology domain-containing protein, partial [Paenibacillus sepulcri]|nr:S-layer homology domain-containing protein [Paenibacillus sepulcri]
KAVELGVITGYNGSFNPGDTATRAEAVSVLMRMIDKK